MNDCNTDDKYLNASSHDLAAWKCNKCPRGASCQGPITWNGIKARFGNWHIPNTIKSFFNNVSEDDPLTIHVPLASIIDGLFNFGCSLYSQWCGRLY